MTVIPLKTQTKHTHLTSDCGLVCVVSVMMIELLIGLYCVILSGWSCEICKFKLHVCLFCIISKTMLSNLVGMRVR